MLSCIMHYPPFVPHSPLLSSWQIDSSHFLSFKCLTSLQSDIQSNSSELTPKAVRIKLMEKKSNWKVPTERRVAKFVMRQKSRRKEDGKKTGFLEKLFKGVRTTSNSSFTPTKDPMQNQQVYERSIVGNNGVSPLTASDDHDSPDQEVRSRQTFRKENSAILKVPSSSQKFNNDNDHNIKSNEVALSKSISDLFRKSKIATDDEPKSYQQAEQERKKINHIDDVSAKSRESISGVEEQCKGAVIENVQDLAQIKILDNEFKGFLSTKRSDTPTKDTTKDPYADENDGTKNDCQYCETCTIL